MIGPGLQGVTDRRSKDWLKKWINSSSDFIALEMQILPFIYEEYNEVIMPNLIVEDADFEALLHILKILSFEEVVTADLSVAEDEGIKTSTILMILALFY